MDSLVASQISGLYLITVYLKSDVSVKDTVNLAVQVPELVNFDELFPQGGKPFTFAQTTQAAADNHPKNDYCTTAMGDSLFAGIVDFNFWTASRKGGGKQIIVSINDMSLPWGGAFEYEGHWNVNNHHVFHRVGLSVNVNCGGLSDAKIRKLTWILGRYGGGLNDEYPPQVHYGFFNGGN